MILIYAHTNNVKRMGVHMNYGHKRTGAKVSKRTMFISGTLSAALLFGGATSSLTKQRQIRANLLVKLLNKCKGMMLGCYILTQPHNS